MGKGIPTSGKEMCYLRLDWWKIMWEEIILKKKKGFYNFYWLIIIISFSV